MDISIGLNFQSVLIKCASHYWSMFLSLLGHPVAGWQRILLKSFWKSIMWYNRDSHLFIKYRYISHHTVLTLCHWIFFFHEEVCIINKCIIKFEFFLKSKVETFALDYCMGHMVFLVSLCAVIVNKNMKMLYSCYIISARN